MIETGMYLTFCPLRQDWANEWVITEQNDTEKETRPSRALDQTQRKESKDITLTMRSLLARDGKMKRRLSYLAPSLQSQDSLVMIPVNILSDMQL